MRPRLSHVCGCVLLAAYLTAGAQEEGAISALAGLNDTVSNLVSSISVDQDTLNAYEMLPRVEATHAVAAHLLEAVNEALENTDRLSEEFERKGSESSEDRQRQQFYRDKAASLTRQTNRLFKQKVELERSVQMLNELVAKIRSDPAVGALMKADKVLKSANESLEDGVRLNSESDSKAGPLNP